MAPTLPPCNGRTIAEGFTYRLRAPHRGEIVVFHACGHIGGAFTPDPKSRELAVNKRVIGIPGDTVSGHDSRVYVNGTKADDIVTEGEFAPVHLEPSKYFRLGDNRSYSQDSRVFGPFRGALYDTPARHRGRRAEAEPRVGARATAPCRRARAGACFA